MFAERPFPARPALLLRAGASAEWLDSYSAVAREPLNNYPAILAIRAKRNQGVVAQAWWRHVKQAQRGVRFARMAPQGERSSTH